MSECVERLDIEGGLARAPSELLRQDRLLSVLFIIVFFLAAIGVDGVRDINSRDLDLVK